MSELLGLPHEALDRARRSRDPRFDGKFFIAVLSTGIYCRSICPVRLSSAVRYYATAAGAAEAGFRPCLRCRPEAAPGSPAWTGTSAAVRRALRLIQEGALDTGSVEELAARVGVGARHLNRLLVAQVGASPLSIAQTRRLHFAKQLLDDTDLPITEIALAAGYGSLRRFNGAFKATYKRPPQELRKRRAHVSEAADEITLKLSFRPPYDWPQLLRFLGRHAIAGIERVDHQSYARTVRTTSGYAVVRVTAREESHTLNMQVRSATPADLFELSSTARRVFDLAADPAQIETAFRDDQLLGPLVMKRPGLRIPGVWDPFECAVRSILGEQGNADLGHIALNRLVSIAGERIEAAFEGLTHLFPSPEALAGTKARELGLEPASVDALSALATAVKNAGRSGCTIEDRMRVLARPSVNDACVTQAVALRAFGDPDALPTADLTLRRQAALNGAPLSARAFEARAEAWRPWRGYAAIHLWTEAAETLSRANGPSHGKRR